MATQTHQNTVTSTVAFDINLSRKELVLSQTHRFDIMRISHRGIGQTVFNQSVCYSLVNQVNCAAKVKVL